MTREEKRKYNFENEQNYFYAPFSEQRAELRKAWNKTRKDWNVFLYNAENKMVFKNLDANLNKWVNCAFDWEKKQIPLYDNVDGKMVQTAIGLY